MAFEGMDVEVVQRLGHHLKHQEMAIQGIVSAVDAVVNELQGDWKGADAAEFAGWWYQQHRPALVSASEAVGGLGQSALNNAQQQASASTAGSPAPAPAPAPASGPSPGQLGREALRISPFPMVDL